MKCFKCGNPLSDNDFCLECGTDVTVYQMLVRASNTYYNMGLAKAQVRDLTGAVESLRISLMINKNNIKARNLLGLVYCELGNVVEALSEWVVSKNAKPDKNIAGSYITKIQSNQGKFELVAQTIKKYNQSLRYAKEGNYDMALIQLKKVVAQNSKLIKAQLLLALLYMKDNENTRAKKCLNNVLKTDKNNTLAAQYLLEIASIEELEIQDVQGSFLPKRKKKIVESEPLNGNDVILPRSAYKEPSNGAITVVNILVGVIIGAAMIWFLVVPSRYKGITADYNKSILDYSEKLSTVNVEINSLTKQLEDVKAERDALAEKVSDVTGTDGNNKLLAAVIDSANAYISNETVKAAEYLVDIDVSSLPSDNAKALYNTIAAATMQLAATDLYNQGMNNYNKAKYTEAADMLSRSYKLDSAKEETAYYCAKSYVSLQQTENAKKYYQYIVSSFPNSRFFAEAKTYVTAN